MKTKAIFALLILAVAVFLTMSAFTTMQASQPPVGGITSGELFGWLIGSGGLVIVLSWVCERWAWYQAKTADTKKVLFIVGVVILGSGVHALQLYVPAAAWAQIDPWFQYVSGLVLLGAVAMGYHQLTK